MANEVILIVEDDDKNRKLMRDVLHFKGYRLAEADTGEEGVRLARACHPDLILMDISNCRASAASPRSDRSAKIQPPRRFPSSR